MASRPRIARLAVIGAVAVLGLVSGCAATSPPSSAGAAEQGVVEQFTAEGRRTVPPVTGTLLDGRPFDSRDYAGNVVVYNVWGSWCAPCRKEAPVLRRVWNENRDRELQFVGVNVRDNDKAARAFERNYGIDYPSINTATSSRALLAFGSALPPSAVPSTLIVDAQGRLAARIIGPASYGTLKILVADELEAAPDVTP